MALGRCRSCDFIPVTPEDCARSLMLSEMFDAGEETFGLSRAALRVASSDIQRGGKYAFDRDELARVMTAHADAKSITPRRLILDGVRWLLPPLLLLAIVLWSLTD